MERDVFVGVFGGTKHTLKKDKQIPRMLIPAQPKVFPGRIIPWHDKRQADS